MSLNEITTILPLIVPACGVILLMLILTISRNHAVTLILTVATLALSIIAIAFSSSQVLKQISQLLILDDYALFFMALIFGSTLIVCILSYGYMKDRENIKEEYYILMLLAAIGCAVIVASTHFVSFFMGLEILSVSLYALIAYLKKEPIHIEAGIKYLIPAATSVAFLLMGTAFIYADCGTMQFSAIASRLASESMVYSPLLLSGFALIVVGIGFKLAIVPFHLWAADVYQGAPAPVAGFIATASKGAIFALLLRYFTIINIRDYTNLYMAFVIIAVATMFMGNLLALMQNNVKRIFAYSSIAHMGYLLTAFLAGGKLAAIAVLIYLLTYFVTSLGAFGVITILSGKERDFESLDDYRGLAFQHPYLSGIFTAMLFSLAGIPLTAGFIGKFYIFSANVDARMWLLLSSLIITSIIGLFYYLRIIVTLYLPANGPLEPQSQFSFTPSWSLAGGLTLAFLAISLVWIGIFPSPFISVVENIINSLI